MKRILLLLCCTWFASDLMSQDQPPKTLTTEINNATVYLKSATIQRTGQIMISSGKTTLSIKELSPYINTKSIKVKGEGDFTVLGVDHKLNYLDKVEKSNQLTALEAEVKTVQRAINLDRCRLDILNEKKSLLSTNKNIGSDEGVTVDQFRSTLAFYDEQLTSIKVEELELNYAIEDRKTELADLQSQIIAINENKSLPTGEITVKIASDKSETAAFQISYLVSNAGWYPKYDVRVPDIDQPLQMIYKAEVHQNTGVDWKNVKLKFSNGNPNKSGQAPALSPWRLNYAWNTIYKNGNLPVDPSAIRMVSGVIRDDLGEPLIGATVTIVGSTIGTSTDIDGSYELTLPNEGRQLEISYTGYSSQVIDITSSRVDISLEEGQLLDEVVVVGYASKLQGRASGVRIRGASSLSDNYRKKEAKIITTTVVENTTTVEFEIDKPYTLNSEGTSITVDLKQYDIQALYEYIAVPKLEKSAFLIAKLPDWDQYNLLEGEANLYFQDTYIGRTILDARSISDTLELSLGRDQNILVGRTKIDSYTKRQTIGSNQIESRAFEILVRNKKSKPINITIMDQAPVAAINDINVKIENLSGGVLNASTGSVIWKIKLSGNEQVKKLMAYNIKYPKSGEIALE